MRGKPVIASVLVTFLTFHFPVSSFPKQEWKGGNQGNLRSSFAMLGRLAGRLSVKANMMLHIIVTGDTNLRCDVIVTY